MRRAAFFLLGYSENPLAADPLLRALRRPERDRNLNRTIGGLGLLRCRKAIPDLLKYLARGYGPKRGTKHYNGDEAETYAARALVRIADPVCVQPVIELLDNAKPEVAELARRTLTDLFAKGVPADRCLVPDRDGFKQVRVDELPGPQKLRAAWTEWWKEHAGEYEWSEAGAPLKKKP
jgi:hypothetical protein